MTQKPAPKPQEVFLIGNISDLQLGTIAIFGAEDDIIKPMAFKLITVSSQPNIPVFSKMGEEVPTAPQPADVEAMARMHDQDVDFSYAERAHLDKVFMILRLIGESPNGQKAYAFVNVRADRFENLLRRIHEQKAFNISDYTTLVQTGLGDIPFEINTKMNRDYLFGRDVTNVRIFPPLSEVT